MSVLKYEAHPTAHDFKVLVVDDSRIYRRLVEDTLSEKQYALLFAKSGREAIDLFSQHQPSLVITDWMMPDPDGRRRFGPLKTVNDAHGHDAGDKVLKKFSEILKTNSRRRDICGRIGGEEFLFILTHTTQENASVVIESIRAELQATKFDFDGSSLTVTASFGLAGFAGTQAPDFNRLVSQADAALYAAKRSGRNRIEIAAG
jgi:diguanylate cyclase (GGDEF)-like protein